MFEFVQVVVTLEGNVALWIEEEEVRNTFYGIAGADDSFKVEDLVVVDLHFGDGCFGKIRLVTNRYTENPETFFGEKVVQTNDIGNLIATRPAPAGPEVEQDILTLANPFVVAFANDS